MKQEIVRARGDSFITTSKELYNIFIKPIANSIPPNLEKLSISADEIARGFPWETLMDEQNQYLIQKYSIVNISGLAPTVKIEKAKETFIFALTEANQTIPLEYGKLEADTLSQIVPATLFVGKDFTINNLKNTISKNEISRLHIATHGAFLGTAEKSYLETYEGKIYLNNFSDFLIDEDTKIILLILNGCETALGNKKAPLGFSGVSIRAQIPFIMGTLWVIPDDKSLVNLMKYFYQALEQGKSVDRAKQFAQIKSIKAGENPKVWGSIILIENHN